MTAAQSPHLLRRKFPGESIENLYGIEAMSIEYVNVGDEADTWRLQDSFGSSWCVKWFRRLRARDIYSRVELMERLYDKGFPLPHVRRTRNDDLVGRVKGWGVTVSGWIDGNPVDTLSVATGDSAGRMLARLHIALRRHRRSVQTSRKNWEVDRPEDAIAACQAIRHRIEALRTPGALDERIFDALGERVSTLWGINEMRDSLPRMERQVLHCDYTRGNLLFTEESLVGVLDLLGNVGYPAWELGRLAFEPATVVLRSDWLQVVLAVFAGYRAETPVSEFEVATAVRTTLLYNLFSLWGISGRYPATGEVIATGNEGYWLNRHIVAQLLVDNLSDIEALVASKATTR